MGEVSAPSTGQAAECRPAPGPGEHEEARVLAALGCRQDVPDGRKVYQEASALRPFQEGSTLSLEEPFTVVFKGPAPRLGSSAIGLNLSVWSTLFLSHKERRPQHGVEVTRAACYPPPLPQGRSGLAFTPAASREWAPDTM